MKVYGPRKCPQCGKEFTPTAGKQRYCCKDCYKKVQRKNNREYQKLHRKEKKKEKPKPNQELIDMAAEARRAGMTYGQYVAQQYARGNKV